MAWSSTGVPVYLYVNVMLDLRMDAEDVDICLRTNMLLDFPSIDSRAKQSKAKDMLRRAKMVSIIKGSFNLLWGIVWFLMPMTPSAMR